MKIKKIQYFSRSLCLKLLIGLLLIPLFSAMLSVEISAKESIDENYKLIEEYSSLLGDEINYYTGLDTTPTKGISKSVTEVINTYRKKLLDIQSHQDIDLRPLGGEILLAYTQGVSAGRLGWIYYFNLPDISSPSSLATLEATYAELSDKISASDDPAVLSALADNLCNSLNRAVYKEKLLGLSAKGDSVYCASIIAGAIDESARVSSPDIFGELYSKVYTAALDKLTLQRARDSLNSQMKDIFAILQPGEELASNEHTALLVYKLQDATELSAMNTAMRMALRGLIQLPEDQSYSYIYSNKLNTAISDVALRADSAGTVGEFLSLFKNYPLERAKASLKDEIASLLLSETDLSEELKAIEAAFNKDGAIVDLCENTDELKAEKKRAEYKKLLYDEWKSAKIDLSTIMGPHDASAFIQRIDTLYSAGAGELDALSKAADKFVENCNSSLEKSKDGFASILTESKADRYLKDHKNIIKKAQSELSVNDELALRSAVISYISLPKSVCEMLESQINSIIEKYKSVLNSKIRSLRSDDAFYLDICEKICVEISSTPSNNIDIFYFAIGQAQHIKT